jgi:hypothetical protein
LTDELASFFYLVGSTLLGVVIGGLLQYYITLRQDARKAREEEKKSRELAREYMKHLTNEILEAISILERKLLQLLPDDVWKSVVNSGHLALLPYDAWEDLRTAYFAMSKCNYEAIRSRDLSVALQIHGDFPANQQRIMSAWKWTSNQAQGMAESTFAYLQGLRQKKWFIEAVNWKSNPTND